MTPADVAEPIMLWPDTERSIRWFIEMSTQWRTGPGGCVGLDYNTVIALADRRAIAGDDFEELLADMRVMEDEALATMQARREQA